MANEVRSTGVRLEFHRSPSILHSFLSYCHFLFIFTAIMTHSFEPQFISTLYQVFCLFPLFIKFFKNLFPLFINFFKFISTLYQVFLFISTLYQVFFIYLFPLFIKFFVYFHSLSSFLKFISTLYQVFCLFPLFINLKFFYFHSLSFKNFLFPLFIKF